MAVQIQRECRFCQKRARKHTSNASIGKTNQEKTNDMLFHLVAISSISSMMGEEWGRWDLTRTPNRAVSFTHRSEPLA